MQSPAEHRHKGCSATFHVKIPPLFFPCQRGVDRQQTRYWLSAHCEHDFLSGLGTADQRMELGFGVRDGNKHGDLEKFIQSSTSQWH